MSQPLIKPMQLFNAEQPSQNLDGEIIPGSRSYTQAEIKALLFPKEILPEGLYEKMATVFSRARSPRDIFQFTQVTAGPEAGDPAVICNGGLYCGGFIINLGWGHRVQRENRFTYRTGNTIARFDESGHPVISVKFHVPASSRLAISEINLFGCHKLEPKTDQEKEQSLRKIGRIARQVFSGTIPNLPALQLQMIEEHIKAGGAYAPEAKKTAEAAEVRFSILAGNAVFAETILKLK